MRRHANPGIAALRRANWPAERIAARFDISLSWARRLISGLEPEPYNQQYAAEQRKSSPEWQRDPIWGPLGPPGVRR